MSSDADEAVPAALQRVLPVLDEARVAYALIGALAMQAHCSASRPTHNVDFALLAVEDAPRSALRAARFTYYQRGAHSVSWRAPASQASGSRIAVRFFSGARRFERAVLRAQLAAVQGLTARVAMPEDLLILKLAAAEERTRRRANRERDIQDIIQLTHEHPHAALLIPGLERRLKVLRASMRPVAL